MRIFRRFWRDQGGVFAVVFAIMAIPIIALAGAMVDYTMWMSARTSAQETADAAALAAATAKAGSDREVHHVASGVVTPRVQQWPGIGLGSATFDSTTQEVKVTISGSVPTYFVKLVGVESLPVNVTSQAVRAGDGFLEVALVLDNTWSMSSGDGNGSSKIESLKGAANSLLTLLFQGAVENVRVGLVPYAEYVNVGLHNRNQPWLNVPADTSSTSTRTCETRTTRSSCTRGEPRTCTRTVDGVTETYDCTPYNCNTYEVPPYEVCWGGGTTTRTWHGCVLSRTPGTLRLSDLEPQTPYVGISSTSRQCMTQIVPLTSDERALRSAIEGMEVNVGSYRPQTYIPAGMVWGVNVLSPTEPFTEGDDYDPDNATPRKAIVLMTDGDNTLRFYSPDGRHVSFSSNTETANSQKAQTDRETNAICSYAKENAIEIFSVTFGDLLPDSARMLAACASSPDHYFTARNSAELSEAFEAIADRLSVVRVTR